jgi:hypothetical protein
LREAHDVGEESSVLSPRRKEEKQPKMALLEKAGSA